MIQDSLFQGETGFNSPSTYMKAFLRFVVFLSMWTIYGCFPYSQSIDDSYARNPAVAADVFIYASMSVCTINGNLMLNRELRNIVSDSLWTKIVEFEHAKRALRRYPDPGWTERSEELFRVYSVGCPLTAFLAWQNLEISDFKLVEFEEKVGKAESNLIVEGKSASPCQFLFIEDEDGAWRVDDFRSEGSTSSARLSSAIQGMNRGHR